MANVEIPPPYPRCPFPSGGGGVATVPKYDPESMGPRDKLDKYNALLLKLLQWEAANDLWAYSITYEEEVKAELAALYASMDADTQVEADQQERRVFRGLHRDNGTTTQTYDDMNPLA